VTVEKVKVYLDQYRDPEADANVDSPYIYIYMRICMCIYRYILIER